MKVGVLGAGLIGSYVGIRLSAAGLPVVLVSRSAPEADRLRAIDLSGRAFEGAADLQAFRDVAALSDVDAVLLCVKSQDTATAAASLAGVVGPNVPVLSLQNGIRNVPLLRETLKNPVVPGMVTFNVRRDGPGVFRRTTSGPLLLAKGGEVAEALVRTLVGAGEDAALSPRMEAVLATKLLLNLNNGLCALTGLPVAESLKSRDLRRCYATCMREALAVMRRAGIPTTRIGPLSPGLVTRVLPAPDFLFFRIARSMLAIDPRARSSTLQDLDAGKRTEIDFLNGEIVRLAQAHGMRAPANAFVAGEVHRLESAGLPPPFLSVGEARAGIERALSS